MKGQMNLFAIEAEQTHQEEKRGHCATCQKYKPEGIKGTGANSGVTFPCSHSEFFYNFEYEAWDEKEIKWIKHEATEQVLYNCDTYRPAPEHFDICGSCKYKNAFLKKTNYCSRGEGQQTNYRCDFLEYVRTGKGEQNNLFEYCYQYYTCDNYEPDRRRKKIKE